MNVSPEQLRFALMKPSNSRSYDDLLMLKAYLVKTDLIKKVMTSLSPKQMDDLCRSLKLENFGLNDVVFKQGDAPECVYIVLSGQCDVRVMYKVELANGETDMREKLVVTCYSGQHFGERALDFDEPRSATVVCSACTELISITKSSYISIIKSVEIENTNAKANQPGTREYVIRVLSKVRNKRTPEEIESVANYLERKVPFFQKFQLDQRLELCRVAETISIWGRSILFKQGSIGQAFYVILTGSVDIFVLSGNNAAYINDDDRSQGIYEGLGHKVNQLYSGDVFGERALENDDSLRMASVVTSEELTELLVISKEDYINLVSVMRHSETMEKLQLLRKTPLFRNVDVADLKCLAQYMEPRKYYLDQIIYTAGEKAMEMFVIERGECRAEVDVDAYSASHTTLLTTYSENHTKNNFDAKSVFMKGKLRENMLLGRIAPYSVLGTCIALSFGVHDDAYYKETVIASTLVQVYVIGKNDFLNSIARESRLVLIQTIKDFTVPVLPQLWEYEPANFHIEDWKISRTWEIFRHDLVQGKKRSNILKTFELLDEMNVSQVDNRNSNNSKKHSSSRRPSLGEEGHRPSSASSDKSGGGGSGGNSDMKPIVNKLRQDVGRDWGTAEAALREKELLLRDATSHIKIRSRKQSQLSAATGSGNSAGLPNNIGANKNLLPALPENQNILRKMSQTPSIKKLNESKSSFFSTTSSSGHSHGGDGGNSNRNSNNNNDNNNNNNSNNNSENSTLDGEKTGSQKKISPVSCLSKTIRVLEEPFTLIQFHREPLKVSAENASGLKRRNLTSFLRICGMARSSDELRDLAARQMQHAHRTLFNCELEKEEQLQLYWKSFNGFEAIPLQNSDHFIIYCRDVPMEVASIQVEGENLYHHAFPLSCKMKNQRFAFIQCRPLSTLRSVTSLSYSSTSPSSQLHGGHILNPPFLAEISLAQEILLVSTSELECLEYIFDHTEKWQLKTNTGDPLYLVLPMHEWVQMQADALGNFEVKRLLKGHHSGSLLALSEINRQLHASLIEHGIMSSVQIGVPGIKSPTKTNRREQKTRLTAQVSLEMLEKEVSRRELSKQVQSHMHFVRRGGPNGNNHVLAPSASVPVLLPSEVATFDPVATAKRQCMLTRARQIRQDIIAMNDRLCKTEELPELRKKRESTTTSTMATIGSLQSLTTSLSTTSLGSTSTSPTATGSSGGILNATYGGSGGSNNNSSSSSNSNHNTGLADNSVPGITVGNLRMRHEMWHALENVPSIKTLMEMDTLNLKSNNRNGGNAFMNFSSSSSHLDCSSSNLKAAIASSMSEKNNSSNTSSSGNGQGNANANSNSNATINQKLTSQLDKKLNVLNDLLLHAHGNSF